MVLTESVNLSEEETTGDEDFAGLGSICKISTSGSLIKTAIKL